MSNFEEARHQGYSASDMAADMEEIEKRIAELGCPKCKYQMWSSHTCDTVIRHDEIYNRCPFWKED